MNPLAIGTSFLDKLESYLNEAEQIKSTRYLDNLENLIDERDWNAAYTPNRFAYGQIDDRGEQSGK